MLSQHCAAKVVTTVVIRHRLESLIAPIAMRVHFGSLLVSATSIITRTSSTASGVSLTTLSKIKSPPSINHTSRLFRVFGPKLMAENPNGKGSPTPVKFSRKVGRLQELMSSDPTSAWERCWEDGVTPWDLGRTTPVIEHLLQKECLPKGTALVPGCGSGHDVVALACPERYVVGLDISDVALSRAKELSTSSPNANYISLLKEDFFTWHPTELFDLVFDYTFFCAIEINMRPAWAKRMAELIKPDGELITLMFPVDDHVGGPPYKTSVADYEMVLHPVGFQATSIVDNELAFGPRKGREKLGRWRKIAKRSSL